MGALTYLLCQQWSCLAAYAGNVSLMTPRREREAARQAAETRYAEPGTWHLEQAAHVTLLEHDTCARYMKHDTWCRAHGTRYLCRARGTRYPVPGAEPYLCSQKLLLFTPHGLMSNQTGAVVNTIRMVFFELQAAG